MGGNNGQPQAAQGNSDMTFSQGQMPSNTMPMQMPSQNQMSAPASNPYGNADDQTIKMIQNMKAMQQSGMFDTPYQKAQKAHPFLMGLANAAQTFGQGLTKQPFATSNQDNQTQLQNTQLQGVNSIATLPAQMRMQMMYMHPELFQQGGQQQPSNIPGVQAPASLGPQSLQPTRSTLPPQLSQPGATVVIGGVPHVRDAQGNWTAQGTK